MLWLVVLLVAAAAVLVVVGAVLAVGRESRERRGGLLELDTWEARNALRLGHPDAGLAGLRGHPYVEPPPRLAETKLRRCNPGRHVHFHGDGDWCECGLVPNVETVRPFAGGGDA